MGTDGNAPGDQKGITSGEANETGEDKRKVPQAQEPGGLGVEDGPAPVDEDMTDVDANNSVSSEHPLPNEYCWLTSPTWAPPV